jgi:hypothetical protein
LEDNKEVVVQRICQEDPKHETVTDDDDDDVKTAEKITKE